MRVFIARVQGAEFDGDAVVAGAGATGMRLLGNGFNGVLVAGEVIKDVTADKIVAGVK